MSIFLEQPDIVELTGYRLKSAQIEQLRFMGIPFFINAAGRPVVTRAAVEGRKDTQDHAKPKWQPRVIEVKQ